MDRMIKVQGQISKEVGEKLVKIEVSFFREETLKGYDIRIMEVGLSFILFSSFSHFYFSFHFLFLDLGLGLSMISQDYKSCIIRESSRKL